MMGGGPAADVHPPIEAYHLPWLEENDVAAWLTRDIVVDGAPRTLRWPRLTPQGCEWVAVATRTAGEKLRAMPAREIVDDIGAAVAAMRADAAAWNDLVTTIAAVTGYSVEMAHYVADRMARDWTRDALLELIETELGGTAILDGFVQRGRARVHAAGMPLTLHIFSGNVPGVAVTSIIRALLVKSAVVGKAASGEPLFAAAFARAVAQVNADIGNAIAVTYWEGGDEDIERIMFRHADCVVHYGAQASLDDVRKRLPPNVALIDHGPRISFGLISRDALAADDNDILELAGDVAHAVATFDQQGCVSPHVLFLETGGAITPRAFAELLAGALQRLAADLPGGNVGAADAAAIRNLRNSAEFRGISGEDTDVHGPDDLSFTVVHDPRAAFTAGCFNRTITIHPVDRLEDVASLLEPFRAVLQSAAVAAPRHRVDDIAVVLAGSGVTRITNFRDLPWPPPAWHHDGRGPLLELTRFTDLE